MPNDLQLSDQDEVLLESLVLAASDNVARAPASDRDQYAPERRRAFVETSGAGNVYLGTGSTWVDVSENTGLLSKLFSGGDGNFDSVNTDVLKVGEVLTKVRKENLQSISSNTTTKIEFGVVDNDQLNSYTESSSDVTIPRDGSYSIKTKLRMSNGGASTSGDRCFLSIYVNGTQETALEFDRPEDFRGTPTLVDDLELNSGDVIDIRFSNETNSDEISNDPAQQYLSVTSSG